MFIGTEFKTIFLWLSFHAKNQNNSKCWFVRRLFWQKDPVQDCPNGTVWLNLHFSSCFLCILFSQNLEAHLSHIFSPLLVQELQKKVFPQETILYTKLTFLSCCNFMQNTKSKISPKKSFWSILNLHAVVPCIYFS